MLAFVIAEEYEVYQAVTDSLINLHSSEREKNRGGAEGLVHRYPSAPIPLWIQRIIAAAAAAKPAVRWLPWRSKASKMISNNCTGSCCRDKDLSRPPDAYLIIVHPF